jgi:hypothetical protein
MLETFFQKPMCVAKYSEPFTLKATLKELATGFMNVIMQVDYAL